MEPRLLNIRALGEYIGLSHETVRKQIKARTFPVPPVTGTGRGRRWDRVEVDRWIETQKRRREA